MVRAIAFGAGCAALLLCAGCFQKAAPVPPQPPPVVPSVKAMMTTKGPSVPSPGASPTSSTQPPPAGSPKVPVPQGGSAKAPANAAAARRETDVRAINEASWLYQNDTGTMPASVSDLARPPDGAPAGYNGPYLRGMPTDPDTGKPYVLRDGMVASQRGSTTPTP